MPLWRVGACCRSLSTPQTRSIGLTKPVQLAFSISFPLQTQPDFNSARKWYNDIQGTAIAREVGHVSYSRSSGPGGQNVNKVNSKAQLRVSLNELLPLIPTALHEAIKASRYYSEKTSSLLIQSDESRRQATNKEMCYKRLNELILNVYRDTVPGETSEEQKEKVKGLKQAENEARIRLKKHISNKKAARRGGSD